MRLSPASRSSTFLLTAIVACTRPDVRASDTAFTPPVVAIDTPAVSTTPIVIDSVVASAKSADASAAPPSCVVTAEGIGPIKLGATLAAAKRALPSATFEVDEDADGVPLIGVTVGGQTLMALFADIESDSVDWEKPIQMMETFNAACATTDGIHPESRVLDVEKVFGRTTRIMLSEIESRQYIEFERQPRGMIFRLDYTGIFPEGSRETRRFEPEAKIFSIAISGTSD